MEEEIYCLRSIDVFTELGCSSRSVDILTKHKYSSLRSMKRREGVFSPKAQKRYVYKSSMHRKEVNYKIVYILDSKLYTSNITDLVQQMLQ
jgi:predicted transcriptional regulator